MTYHRFGFRIGVQGEDLGFRMRFEKESGDESPHSKNSQLISDNTE
jgi:hypothetical protein